MAWKGSTRRTWAVVFSIEIVLFLVAVVFWRASAFRAVRLSVSSLGYTCLSLAVALLVAILPLLRSWRSGGWTGVRAHWRQDLQVTAPLFGSLVGLVVAYHFFFPTFSLDEIAQDAYGFTVAVGEPNRAPAGTGFWVGKSYAVTCLPERDAQPTLSVTSLTPPILYGKTIIVPVETLTVGGQRIYYDSATNIAVVFVPESPFNRRRHMFAESENNRTHKKERTSEKYSLPSIAKKTFRPGEVLYVAAVIRAANGGLELNTVETRVTRIGADTTSNERFRRVYTSAPFAEGYRGAPVVNDREEVVGVVAAVPAPGEDTAVVIPAEYLSEVVAGAHLRD